jgi:ferredoxin
MRVSIDEDACVGTGQCELICPEVFRVDMISHVLVDAPGPELHDQVREAADNCPTEAVRIHA